MHELEVELTKKYKYFSLPENILRKILILIFGF